MKITKMVTNWGVVLAMLSGVACTDGTPIVVSSKAYPSPDQKWDAVVEEVDNGLGFGQGEIFYEVHVCRHGEKISGHGKWSDSLFYAPMIYTASWTAIAIVVQWIDADHLQIEYPDINQPGRMDASDHGVAIQYKTFPTPKDAQ